ncbi:Os11g0161700 [Oryza sativa Japonica Group]|uniref:Os11g0161700 protein n=1 Tax=Oryza sativa subsp. japonica TaxID=39947 RepID=A0A0P0XZ40_ORYSJ|nr:hypothetical protein EE612_053671 [Oryza sativa]BAT12804.1 Os11g0161700 [Oryza sativa Japonica Group]
MAGEEGGWWCELAAAAEATRFKVNLSAGSSLRYNNITATTQARKMIVQGCSGSCSGCTLLLRRQKDATSQTRGCSYS